MLKRNFNRIVQMKNAIKLPFFTMYEFKTHILRILKKQTANLKQILKPILTHLKRIFTNFYIRKKGKILLI